MGEAAFIQVGLLDGPQPPSAIGVLDRLLDVWAQTGIVGKHMREPQSPFPNAGPAGSSPPLRLVVPFEHMQQQYPQRTFELVELFAPQGLDLLSQIFPIERFPASCAQVARLLRQPGVEVALYSARSG